jgi:peptidoglycan/LPS O-acetylase OafA/YrhL
MSDVAATAMKPHKTGYLPSLDGWRALAIIGVLMTHDRPWDLFGHSSVVYKGYGGYGVYLFFAISGFLITSRILEEEKICGYFDIRRFYIRRLFRIQPAALAYLAVIAILILVGLAHESWPNWLAALLLYTNFLYRPGVYAEWTGHFWTLAVEEHFYILLSLTLLVVKKHRTIALGGLFLGFTALTTLSYGIRHHWYNPEIHPRATQWQLTPLLLAALVAAIVRRAWVLRMVRLVLRPWVAFVLTPVAMMFIADLGQVHQLWHYHRSLLGVRPFHGMSAQLIFGRTYLLIFWVVATVFHPNSWTTRFMELWPLRFIGRISYSLYLWHGLVFWLWGKMFSGNGPFAHLQAGRMPYTLLERPMRVATAFGVATLSYYFIEKPMIRKGHKLAPPATPGRLELADLPVESPRRHVPAMDRVG